MPDFSYRGDYLKKDKKLTKYITDKSLEYGINPYLALHRLAKEGLVDNQVKRKATKSWLADGLSFYDHAFFDLGLDDVYSNAKRGLYKFNRPIHIKKQDNYNEQGRDVQSGEFSNKYDALEAYIADLAYRQKSIKTKLPNLSQDELDTLTSAAYNMGVSGAINSYNSGTKYKDYAIAPYIKNIQLDYNNLDTEPVTVHYRNMAPVITEEYIPIRFNQKGIRGANKHYGKGQQYSYRTDYIADILNRSQLPDEFYKTFKDGTYAIYEPDKMIDELENRRKLTGKFTKEEEILYDLYNGAVEDIVNYNRNYTYKNPYANLDDRLQQKYGGHFKRTLELNGNIDYPGFKNGGSIHIKPSKRGTFTAAAKKHGMGVQAFASRVLANKENYSPAMVKKANFARNASKWH